MMGTLFFKYLYQLLIKHIDIEFNVSKISLSIHIVTPHHTDLRITYIAKIWVKHLVNFQDIRYIFIILMLEKRLLKFFSII